MNIQLLIIDPQIDFCDPKGALYVKSLAAGKRYVLVIWPEHCLIGTIGHAVAPVLNDALAKWQDKNFGMIDFVTKGSNPFTEHYSVVKADVPDAGDPTTNI